VRCAGLWTDVYVGDETDGESVQPPVPILFRRSTKHLNAIRDMKVEEIAETASVDAHQQAVEHKTTIYALARSEHRWSATRNKFVALAEMTF
jgi:hypothetical protein